VIGFVSAAVGVAATLLLLVAFGALGERNRSTIPPPGLTNPESVVNYAVATRVCHDVCPSVVTLRITSGDSTTFGTAVAVNSDRVLTSAHLIFGATALSVVTGDRTVAAKIVGSDPDTDLVLLDVSDANLPYPHLAGAVSVGEPVLAVAMPKGKLWLDLGIVSRENELAQWSGTTMAGLLQADVTSAADMSGGALFDANGYLVGILTAPPGVASPGLAVPISVADDVRRQLEANGTVLHGWLGVTLEDSKDPLGARVAAVTDEGPASGKLAVGDVVTRTGSDPVTDSADLMAEWRSHHPGDSLTLSVRRGRDDKTVTVTLRPDPARAKPSADADTSDH
jgi:S1-C subfamily serine protease